VWKTIELFVLSQESDRSCVVGVSVMCAGGIDLGCLYYFPIIYRNCSGGVVNFALPFIVKHKYIKDENRRCSREKEMKLVQYFSFSPAI
jgi:hypothetical protein